MRSPKYLALLGLFLAAPSAAQTPAATAAATAPAPDPTRVIPPKLDYDSLAFGRQMTMWFYSAEVDSLWAHTHPMMQQQMGSKEKWSEMVAQFAERGGMETDLVEERWVKRNGKRQYWHIFHASEFTQEPLMLRWVLEPGKLVGGLGLNPVSQAPAVDPN
ncbi:MAG: hypothetical protein JF590_02745 [Gemmatimonadetes bacterium]|nr:hypothetical protein [Gemmatimonadota bacterium]